VVGFQSRGRYQLRIIHPGFRAARESPAASSCGPAFLSPSTCATPNSAPRTQNADQAVPVLQYLSLVPPFRRSERIALSMTENKQSFGAEQMRQSGIIQQLLSKRCRTSSHVLFSIGRVRQNQLKPLVLLFQLGYGREHILHPGLQDSGTKAGNLEILTENRGVLARFLHANRRHRPTAQTFQAQRAGARKQLQHVSADRAFPQAVENRLFYQVRRRTQIQPLGNFEAAASRLSTGNPHHTRLAVRAITAQQVLSIDTGLKA